MELLLAILAIPTVAIIFWVLKDIIWFFVPSSGDKLQANSEEKIPSIPTKHAWQRFLARMLDITIGGAALGVLIAFDTEGAFEEIASNNVALGVFSINFCLFYEISCLASFKTTIGKKIMGVDIIFPTIQTTLPAIKRGVLVWYRGLAGGYPFFNLFTMYAGFQNFKKYGKNSWDMSAGTELRCQEIHISRWLLGILVFLSNYVFLLLYAFLRFEN